MITLTECPCISPDHHGDECGPERLYYVTLINSSKTKIVAAAGPYATHREAQGKVALVRQTVHAKYAADPHEPWFSYGTSAGPTDDPFKTACGTL